MRVKTGTRVKFLKLMIPADLTEGKCVHRRMAVVHINFTEESPITEIFLCHLVQVRMLNVQVLDLYQVKQTKVVNTTLR